VTRILVVNPNTTEAVTDRIARVARAAASADTVLDAVTAPFGPAIITSRAEDALAGHGVLEAVARSYDAHGAVILAASWDTALAGLRELLPVPVVGLTESAVTVASLLAERFALVTVGPRAASGHRRLVLEAGLGSRLAGIGEVDLDYTAVLREPAAAVPAVARAAVGLVERQGAEAIIPAGAVFAGLHVDIQRHVPVPVLDAVSCAVQLAECLARLAPPKPAVGSRSRPPARPVSGVSAAVARLFGGADGRRG
jgi:allantoin racemase